jgi:hypothetical protein
MFHRWFSVKVHVCQEGEVRIVPQSWGLAAGANHPQAVAFFGKVASAGADAGEHSCESNIWKSPERVDKPGRRAVIMEWGQP